MRWGVRVSMKSTQAVFGCFGLVWVFGAIATGQLTAVLGLLMPALAQIVIAMLRRRQRDLAVAFFSQTPPAAPSSS